MTMNNNEKNFVFNEDVNWEYGNFDGFDDQKRCVDCGHSLHKDNDGSHQCIEQEAMTTPEIQRYENGLLPCPFCGDADKPGTHTYPSGITHGECMECGARGPLEEDVQAARDSWNKRSKEIDEPCNSAGCQNADTEHEASWMWTSPSTLGHPIPVCSEERQRLIQSEDYSAFKPLHSDHAAAIRGLSTPITMQDVRLAAGEGKLTAQQTLDACNAVLRSRSPEDAQDNASLLKTISDIRFAIGDDGKAMLDELPRVCGKLRARAGRLEEALKRVYECDWEQGEYSNAGDNRIGPIIEAALAGEGEK